MALDGHPWLTEELDLQRAEQRRWLAGLPDAPMMSATVPEVAVVDVDPSFLERLLRSEASAVVNGLEASGVSYSDTEAAAAAVLAEWASKTADLLGRRFDVGTVESGLAALDDQSKKLRKAALARITEEDWARHLYAVYLLVWADDLAADYTDSRVAARRSQG
ncbi:MAG: hypothetical protein ACSLFP_16345 [Acidimicrobiales bacterium]